MKFWLSYLFLSVLCSIYCFVLFGQNDRLYLVEGHTYDSSPYSNARLASDIEDFDYSTIHFQFDELTCPDNNYNNFDNYPDDVKAWAPNDLDPTKHEALYYDQRFEGSQFLCYGIEDYKDIGLKYAFSNDHYGDPSMIIAIIDSGLKPDVGVDHALYINTGETANNGIDDDGNGYVDDFNGYDFFYDTGSESRLISNDNSGHGSNMARIIVGEINDDDTGELGVCPNCRFMNLKVFGSGDESHIGLGVNEQAAASIRYAVDNGAKIIMLAIGYGDVVLPEAISPDGYREDFISDYLRLTYSTEWYEALEYAWENNVLVVGSAGNMSLTEPTIIEKAHYNVATNHQSIIQVGGVYPGIMAHHTSVARPGRSVDIVVPDWLFLGGTNTAGTSEATALVAGMIGNYWSEFPTISHYNIKKRVLETAIDNLWNLESERVHYYSPEDQIVDIFNPDDAAGILPRDRWPNNAPLTDDQPGWDEYFGYGLLEFESLYTGDLKRTVNIDEATGSVEGYTYPTSPYLEDYSVEFQNWIGTVLDVEDPLSPKFTLFPNPATEYIQLDGLNRNSHYQIFSVSGLLYDEGAIENKKINVSQLKIGTYIIQISNKNQTLWRQRFIIE